MGKKINMIGRKFGRLTVVEENGRDKHGHVKWECLCDCGKIVTVVGTSLKTGNTKSCGCLNLDNHIVHGMSGTPTYKSWMHMTQRCNNSKDSSYSDYGGRGILVCDRWLVFGNFFKDMGFKPAGLTIERIDNNKGYFPDNCKWATYTEQNRNKRIRKNSATGTTGVYWNKQRQRYQVAIMANYKRFHIGRFPNIQDAITARKQAESRHWG